MALISCGGTRPIHLGIRHRRLAPCPQWPNCVSSDATDAVHAIAHLVLKSDAAEPWVTAREVVAGLARTRLITDSADYMHAECQSALLGLIDDVELHLRASDGVIAVRSAARLGIGDLGVNRRRIENLRSALVHLDVVE